MSTDTIAAIGTALSNSGISIIRISGRDSLALIDKIFKSNQSLEPNKIIFGKIVKNEKKLDNVLVSYFKSPKSYTGEDVCEINCHGGNEITREILELVLENGARIATPGEFSKRAFINGKMDLTQSEAVINLINAKTRIESRIASKQLDGNLYSKIKELREELVELLAHIEVSIDYPEYDYEEVEPIKVKELLYKKIEEIQKIIDTYEQGRIIKNGVNVAILGRPNVGKSSLLNKLAEYEKAIVTDIPGTTRDIVEESINIGDIILNVFDTAGIRETEDIVEKIGVEKTLKKLDEVDLVIYILNAEEKVELKDFELIAKIKNKGIKLIVVINKMDRVEKSIFDTFMLQLKENNIETILPMSLINDDGIEELKNEIVTLFHTNDFDYEHELMITNVRHKDLLKKAIHFLKNASKSINSIESIDIISIHVKNATRFLGEIIGEDVSVDVVNKIFEKFCLGK
ncbi:MAG: tRNA uridine-5-carboxymethylaminomethyl(34) synthesis GTPase MnmE [Clostridia bacterium]|nr:tRNA uridine-5-carboxymethylaminomethyl(34) synthesis GTPase MnmE [Clostridia bacterium]